MREHLSGLGIPFEHKTPVEGADLKDEDYASSKARRPSPESPSVRFVDSFASVSLGYRSR